MFQKRNVVLASLLLFPALWVLGCSDKSKEPDKKHDPHQKSATTPEKKPAEEHGHKPGAHGGIIVEIGGDNYHAEAVVEKNGILRLYILGKDETRVQEVESQKLTAFAQPEGGMGSASVALEPAPQTGDTAGKTSQFVGLLPEDLRGKALEVTIPNIRVAGERFRIHFKTAGEAHHEEEDMGAKVSGDAEKALYLTPGGKYTEADIKANGHMTASQKFKGIKSSHNVKTKPGEKICPISETKANPKFTWIIGGMPYEFCCPPCVDEFLQLAKERPNEIKDPAGYVKKE